MRIVYVCLGFVFLAVGIAGIILPLLPGTVNLLIAAFFFAKGSPRMEAWLLNHRHLGPHIRNWREDGSMTRKSKIIAITSMWLGIGYGVLMAPWYGGACAVLLGIYGAWYIITRPTRAMPVAVPSEVPVAAQPADTADAA